MGKIILVLGPHAVGKTTLFKYARERGETLVYDGYQLPVGELNLSEVNDFIEYQEKYVSIINQHNLNIKKGLLDGLVNRSIEESSYYYQFHSKCEDVMEHYKKIVEEYSNIKVDLIIYLDADYSTLVSRYSGDSIRDLDETLEWYEKEYVRYEKYWKKYSGVKIINTINKDTKEIYDEMMSLLEG